MSIENHPWNERRLTSAWHYYALPDSFLQSLPTTPLEELGEQLLTAIKSAHLPIYNPMTNQLHCYYNVNFYRDSITGVDYLCWKRSLASRSRYQSDES